MHAHPESRAAALLSIAYHLPPRTCDSADLARKFPEWGVDKIEAKTGISVRHIAAENETSADLAAAAAERLFAQKRISPSDIDYVIFCTQTPDHFLPPSACILQTRLGIPNRTGAFDFNLGCSGFVYGLGLAKGLIETGQASNVLLLTAETYSKLMHPEDKSCRTIFGDGGAAAWIGSVPMGGGRPYIAAPSYGTDGQGAKNLIVRNGAFRTSERPIDDPDSYLYMNGPEIFHFTLDLVATSVKKYLEAANLTAADIDLMVPHQANAFMLNSIRTKIGIPRDRFSIQLKEFGNTVSATIPIALTEESKAGRLQADALVLLAGFGVGYSWASTLLRWHPDFTAA